ncbi:HAD-IA family hydrolase (plasmid) [Streptomyces sp. NBC_00841]|uniref:HAD family hydrolase n=1 Tax=unclassified Streptomyces TaxID=2593676 RepID=UPI0022503317|nr:MULTISPECIES: HAD-IA family hydrolase [unclassified Streptomyces]MCX4537892.1 HAD-IA family hydrolase [Streptomyces sp. NBC_01669]WSA05083.1 HAD-IA family hydrolase [Streptomyces sp. NBC_00841]
MCATRRRLTREEREALGSLGERAAEAGIGLRTLVRAHLSAAQRMRPGLPQSAQVSQAQARELGMALAQAPFWADEVVVALLRRVRAHMPLVLVTNATLELENDLASLGLEDFADHVVSSARVGVAKPDRKIYEIAAERAGVAMDRCLFVDDRRENVDAAAALGMTGVHYRESEDLRESVSFLLDGQVGYLTHRQH